MPPKTATTADIIASGNYLDSNFNISALTIPHLTGILTYHGAKFPSNAKKTQLIDAFNIYIAPRREQLMEERLIASSSQASDKGIRDGVTGDMIGEPDVRSIVES